MEELCNHAVTFPEDCGRGKAERGPEACLPAVRIQYICSTYKQHLMRGHNEHFPIAVITTTNRISLLVYLAMAATQKLYPRATVKKIVKAHSQRSLAKNVDVLVGTRGRRVSRQAG